MCGVLLVIKSTNWSKFLDPVHGVVSAIELSGYALTLRTHQQQKEDGRAPGICMSASSMPDIFEKVLACIEVM